MNRIKDNRDGKWMWFVLSCRHTVKAAPFPGPGLGLGLAAVAAAFFIVTVACLMPAAPAPGIASHAYQLPHVLAVGGLVKELVELNDKLKAKQDELAKVFDEATVPGTSDLDFSRVKVLGEGLTTTAKLEKVRSMNNELDAIGKERDAFAVLEQAKANLEQSRLKNGTGGPIHQPNPDPSKSGEQRQVKTLGEFFVESQAYKDYKASGGNGISKAAMYDAEMKTLMSNSAGWAPESLRSDRVVPIATRPIQIIDAIPQETTSYAAIKYMEETTFTNNAAEAAEGAAYAENAFALTERSVTVEKIAVFLPVSDEQLEDEPRVRSFIDNRLMFSIRQKLDSQIVQGSGSTPSILGILNKSGIQTQALGTDPVPDAIRKAMTKVRVTGRAVPNLVLLHPNDWQDIRLLRTADGHYIWGNPSEAGIERIWGVMVVEADSLTENTGIVGDFLNFSALVTKRGIDLQVGYINDDFQKGRKSIRADMRVATVWYRAAAFATVTGI